MKHPKTLAACLSACLISAVSSAQNYATFRFRGFVETEVPSTYTNHFNVGDEAFGFFTLNLDDVRSLVVPPNFESIRSYEVFYDYVASITIGTWSGTDDRLAVFENERRSGGDPLITPAGDRLDQAMMGMSYFNGFSLLMFLEGPSAWLGEPGTNDEAIETLNLAALNFARIVPSNRAFTVRITSLSRDGFGLLATPNQRVAQFAEPNAVLDIFDLFGFLAALDAQDPSADLAAPIGTFDVFDLFQFLDEAALVPTE